LAIGLWGPVWVPGFNKQASILIKQKQKTNKKIRTQVHFVFYSSVILIRIKIRKNATVKIIKRTGSKCSKTKNPPGPRDVKVKEEITIRGFLFLFLQRFCLFPLSKAAKAVCFTQLKQQLPNQLKQQSAKAAM
jgi:hypothetical protein